MTARATRTANSVISGSSSEGIVGRSWLNDRWPLATLDNIKLLKEREAFDCASGWMWTRASVFTCIGAKTSPAESWGSDRNDNWPSESQKPLSETQSELFRTRCIESNSDDVLITTITLSRPLSRALFDMHNYTAHTQRRPRNEKWCRFGNSIQNSDQNIQHKLKPWQSCTTYFDRFSL